MVWPFDADFQSFSALTPLPSTHLNEVQQQIQNIAGGVGGTFRIPLLSAIEDQGAPDSWLHEGIASIEEGWVSLAVASLYFPIPMRQGAKLSKLRIKVENVGGVARNWSFNVVEIDANWLSAATAPASTAIATADPLSVANAWSVITLDTTVSPNLLPRILSADSRMLLRILNFTVGDHIAGVEAEYTQLY